MTTLTTDQLHRENEALRLRLEEAEEALQALRTGTVDAVLVGADEEQVFTLEAAETPYRLLVEQVSQPAASLTADGTVLACNVRFADLLATPRGALLGRPFASLVTPESLPLVAALLHDGRLGESHGEVILQQADGSPVPAWLGVKPVQEGAFGLCLVVTDLTQQRHYDELQAALAALRASEERYRTLFESIDEGFCVIEVEFNQQGRATDYRFLETNPRFDALTGLQDAVGKSMRQLRPGHEEHWFETYGRIARTGVPDRFQQRAEALGRWYDVYAFRIGAAEERKVAVLFNDITANRLAEERLRQQTAQFEALLYNAPLAVYLADGDLRLLAVNPAAGKLFGGIPDPVGRSLEELASVIWPAERAAEVLANFRRTLATGDPYVVPEWEEQRGEGGPAEYHEWQINRLPLPEGGFGVVCYARDITSHVRARQALHESERALKQADQRKDEFLATLAHELRNPLAPIRNAVQLLMAKGPPDPDLQWARGIIDRQVSLMARLLEDLLDISRISRNRLELRTELVDLAQVVRTAVETSRPMIEARGHQLSLQLPLRPVRLRADAVRLAQVFSNLLNNSAKFTEPGGAIWLTAERADNEIRVSVKDTGVGISPEMLPRIFDMFSQDSSAGRDTSEGLGIGLSLVKGLVEMHGGSIEARSSGPGGGSEFIVRLPLPDPEAGGLADGVATAARPTQIRHRILVVDDNRDSADTLAMLLSVMGNEVRTAYGGEQALEAAEDLRPDVVLLDVEMPGIDGHETCRRMREQAWGRTAFMVALTGWGQETDRQRTREAGFDHHMVKPIDPDALEAQLSSLPAPD